MKQPFCAPSEALRRVLDAAAALPRPETETVPDYVTLAAPPEAIILQNQGPIRNGYGEFAWIKYMLPYQPDRRRARSKRRRRRKKE